MSKSRYALEQQMPVLLIVVPVVSHQQATALYMLLFSCGNLFVASKTADHQQLGLL